MCPCSTCFDAPNARLNGSNTDPLKLEKPFSQHREHQFLPPPTPSTDTDGASSRFSAGLRKPIDVLKPPGRLLRKGFKEMFGTPT
jgi:hypothetical protein